MNKEIPNGLVFSSNSTKRKKRALTLVAVLFVLQICLIWPIYPMFASPTPQILGFPLSIIWVVFILVLAFTSVLVFFRKDIKEES
ncbi:MAG: hypothetical protein RLN90_04420 [Balneolaceae bacterium]